MDRMSRRPVVDELSHSNAPVAIELGAQPARARLGLREALAGRVDALRWALSGRSNYAIGGALLGVAVIASIAFAFSFGADDSPATAAAAVPPPTTDFAIVSDDITRLHARDIADACWRGLDRNAPVRMTVALEVGADGRVRHAVASGDAPAMRACVEAHVRSWEFLPQAQPTTIALPFEIDRR